MKICLIDGYIEAWRVADDLIRELQSLGHLVTGGCEAGYDFIICGSINCMPKAKELQQRFPAIPLLNYNWDVYSFKVHCPNSKTQKLWQEYGQFLRTSAEVWCPSQCTVERTKQYFGVDSIVLKCAASSLGETEIFDGGYVLDPLRDYEPRTTNYAHLVCEELGISCRTPDHQVKNEAHFRRLVAGCRFIVSAKREASTGGMTMLEGYTYGKTSLISDSAYHGGRDYFGDRAVYFNWKDRGDFKAKLHALWNQPPVLDLADCRRFIEENYSPRAMAERINTRLVALKK